ncbi:uracil phosphoribosyltransferase [Bacillus sp. FJAT-22090]|uniref:uracil phosphoribosyltransferase n=1 Tax=Bacillus sp. FJAT-22090 TaxID=1581038 RepID=UPI0021B32DBA|nr:uracil phosphoribosyltransferase [Bacillus sp. FJAT-22090]
MYLKIIEDKYSLALQTKIRSRYTEKDDLKGALIKLGQKIGIDIVSDNMLEETEVSTPMDQIFQGYSFSNSVNLVYSTKDDYEFFAKGLSLAIPNSMQGYFDFQGVRGPDALTQPIRASSHPSIKPGTIVDTVVIAKAVLATGCTAISLAKNIMSKFQPKKIIIASSFYSQTGVIELVNEIPNIKFIYAVGKADKLNEDGMLIPGVGNLDSRLLG